MAVLSAADMQFWQENGYVVLPNAVPQENLDAVVAGIWAYQGQDPRDPESWYRRPDGRFTSMIEMYHHQAMWDNRQSERIYGAFVDLWQTEKLWVSLDRVSMNPPARPEWDYDGFVHWDIDTTLDPLPKVIQGVLYLTDTTEDQGGFQCVPGFHKRFGEWVKSQPADRDPRRPDLSGLRVKPIAGKAGDLIIWDALLPHGNGRNRSTQPRLAQYITMYPAREQNEEERRLRIQAWQERLPPRGKAFPGDPRELEQKSGQPAQLTDLGRRLLGLNSWT